MSNLEKTKIHEEKFDGLSDQSELNLKRKKNFSSLEKNQSQSSISRNFDVLERTRRCSTREKSSNGNHSAIRFDLCPLIRRFASSSTSSKINERSNCSNKFQLNFSRCFDKNQFSTKRKQIKTSNSSRITKNTMFNQNFLSQNKISNLRKFESIEISRIPKKIAKIYDSLRFQTSPIETFDEKICVEIIEKVLDQVCDFESSENLKFDLIDIGRFRLSAAALIHLESRRVIYLEKNVVWFGSTTDNEIRLNEFELSRKCFAVAERHACLFYDRKLDSYELLNYSEHGTVVDGLCYAFQTSSDDEQIGPNGADKLCPCLINSFRRSAWDGAAPLERGTIFRIGCHSFIFYRNFLR